MHIGRSYRLQENVGVNTAVGTSDPISFGDASGGRIIVPTGSSLTSLAVYESHNDVDYVISNDDTETALVLTVTAGNAYMLPTFLFGAKFIKLVGNVAGTVHVTTKT